MWLRDRFSIGKRRPPRGVCKGEGYRAFEFWGVEARKELTTAGRLHMCSYYPVCVYGKMTKKNILFGQWMYRKLTRNLVIWSVRVWNIDQKFIIYFILLRCVCGETQ